MKDSRGQIHRTRSGARAATDRKLRQVLMAASCELLLRGLTHGKSGNVSVRRDESHFFITPTGMDYEMLAPQDMALVSLDGRWFGRHRPSSEWRFHRDIFRSRSDAGAVVHTHSLSATALACTGRGIPAFHYMVAAAGGVDIRCAPYHTFGSQELSAAALTALEGRRACLLGNHGVIALGSDLDAALSLAGEVENLAAQYRAALALGQVKLLDEAEMTQVIEKFRTYGRPDAPDADLVFAGDDPSGRRMRQKRAASPVRSRRSRQG
ncbi:MAG TPA: class II aldolase/adducin family protein [Steroidobacteraceae bacterium]|jgi:L-fuculose-phosphate aldolase